MLFTCWPSPRPFVVVRHLPRSLHYKPLPNRRHWNPVQLLDGRYGPYVTDGETNASIPKGTEASAVTLEMALELLAERAAAGGSKKKGRGAKKGAKKSAASTKKAAKSDSSETSQGSYEKEGDENCQEVFAESCQEVGQEKIEPRMMSKELTDARVSSRSFPGSCCYGLDTEAPP